MPVKQENKNHSLSSERGAAPGGKAMILYYSPRCGACRGLSMLAVLLAFGAIRRQSVTDPAASGLFEKYPDWRGQPLIVSGDMVWVGPDVLKAVPISIVRRIANLIGRPRRSAQCAEKNASRYLT